MSKQKSNVDTIATTEETASSGFFTGNVKMWGIIGIVILLAAGGLFYYNFSNARQNEQALIELERIRPYYDKGEFTTAINGDSAKKINNERIRGLRLIVDDFGSTPAGRIGSLWLGNAYLATGQIDKARGPYESASDADADLVSSAGHAGLAAVAEAKNQFDEAAREYMNAVARDEMEINTPRYLLGAARNYERAGKKDEAIKNYRAVATKYPQATDANMQARMALARNNVDL